MPSFSALHIVGLNVSVVVLVIAVMAGLMALTSRLIIIICAVLALLALNLLAVLFWIIFGIVEVFRHRELGPASDQHLLAEENVRRNVEGLVGALARPLERVR
jgi:hypothetical protein